MPRFYESSVRPLRPQTAPLPISDRHVAPMPVCALPPHFAAGDNFTAPPKVIPAIVAAVTLAMWTPTIAQPAVAAEYQQAASFVAPEKVAAAAAPVIGPGWSEAAPPAKAVRFFFPEGFAAPDKMLPPAAIALNHWTPTLGVNAQPLEYDRGSYVAPDKFGIAAPAIVLLPSWLGEAAGPSRRFTFTAGDLLSAPSKTLPPAAITLNHWTSTDGVKAVAYKYSSPEAFCAPDKFGIVSPATVFLPAWLGEIAPPAKRFTFLAGDVWSSPPKLFPPAPITLNHWSSTDGSPAVRYIFSVPDAVAAPAKFAVISAAPVTLSSWLGEIAPPAKQFVHFGAEPFAAPAKVLPPAAVTLNSWLPDSGLISLSVPHVLPPALAAPEKILTSAVLPMLPGWLGEMAATARPPRFAAAINFDPPKIFPATRPASIAAQAAYIRAAMEALGAAVRPGIQSLNAAVRASMEAINAAVRAAIEARSAATRPAIESQSAIVRPS